jgi:hypothetical protein
MDRDPYMGETELGLEGRSRGRVCLSGAQTEMPCDGGQTGAESGRQALERLVSGFESTWRLASR